MRASTLCRISYLCAAIAFIPTHAADQSAKAEKNAEPAAIDLNELLSSRDAEVREITIRFAQTRNKLAQERRGNAREIEDFRKEIATLKEKVANGERTIEEITKRYAQTRDELEQERREQAQQWRVMQAEIDSLKKQVGGGAVDIQEIISQREREIEEITNRFAQTRDQLEQERRDHVQETEVLQKEIDTLEDKVADGERTAEEITKRFAQTRDELEQNRRDHADRLKKMQAEINALEKQVARAGGPQENPAASKKAEPAAVDIKEQLANREAEVKEVIKRFAQTRDQLEQERRDHADQIEKLQKEIDELKGKVGVRERDIEEITKRFAQTRDELEQGKREFANLGLEGMRSDDPAVRRLAIRILSKVGVGGKSVDAAVQKAAEDTDPEVQKAAKEILERKPVAPKRVERPADTTEQLAELHRELELEQKTHAKLLANSEASFSAMANRFVRLQDSMSQLKTDFESVAIEGLEDKDPAARRLAVRMLSKFGASGRLAGPALQKAAEDSDPEVQKAAREALKKQRPAASKGK